MSDDKTQVIVYIRDLGKLPEFEQSVNLIDTVTKGKIPFLHMNRS